MTADVDDDAPWSAFIDATLGALERDPEAARASLAPHILPLLIAVVEGAA